MKKVFFLLCGLSMMVAMNAQQQECPAETTNTVAFTLPAGELSGVFSVSATTKIKFSKGNLQFRAKANGGGELLHQVNENGTITTKTGLWRFAEHQYDYVGHSKDGTNYGNVYDTINGSYTKCSNNSRSATYQGWIDIFGWGKTGATYASNVLYPYALPSDGTYCAPGQEISKTNYDFGYYNAISNGGDEPRKWRMFTKAEINYLFFTRTNANNLKTLGRINTGGSIYVNGLFLLPDGWTDISGITITKNKWDNYTTNTFTLAQWQQLEAAGVVFLVAGSAYISSTSTYYAGNVQMWTSTVEGGTTAYFTDCYAKSDFGHTAKISSISQRYEKSFPVRLVRDYTGESSITIDTTQAKSAYGTLKCELVSGSNYKFTATPAVNYEFAGWEGSISGTENPKTVDVSSLDAPIVIRAKYTKKACAFDPAILPACSNGAITYTRIGNTSCDCEWNLTAVPNAGYIFSKWSDDLMTNPREVDLYTTSSIGYAPIFVKNLSDKVSILEWKKNGILIRCTETVAYASATVVDHPASATDLSGGEYLTEVQNTLSLCKVPGEVGVYFLKFNQAEVLANPADVLVLKFRGDYNNEVGTLLAQIPVISYAVDNISNYSAEVLAATNLVAQDGAVLTINQNATIKDLHIMGGAKVVVPATKALTAQNIIMQGSTINDGYYTFSYPQLVVNGTIANAAGKIYYDYLINADQYYSLTLPYNVQIADITYQSGETMRRGYDGITTTYDYKVQYYDGATRLNGADGWKTLGAAETVLSAGKGYTIFAKPQYIRIGGGSSQRQKYCIVRFPMTVDFSSAAEAQKNVPVVAHGAGDGTKKDNDKGWNLIGNPYLANYTAPVGLTTNGIGLLEDDGEGGFEWVGTNRYVVVPSSDGQSFTQLLASSAELPAFKNFFVQIGTGDALQFTLANRAQSVAMRKIMVEEQEPIMGIVLSSANATDRTAILLGDDYTTEYEINADLQKWMNKDLNIYSITPESDKLAFMAIAQADATNIPVGYTTTTAGQCTIALDEQYNASDWESVELYDVKLKTNTNLLLGDYSFDAVAGGENNRFILSLNARTTPSKLNTINGNAAEAKYFDMFGREYKSTGKQTGVYIIRKGSEVNKVINY